MTKTVVITGGGSGIGAACATRFLEQGWQVIAGGLDQDETWPENLLFHPLDVTDVKAIEDFVARAPAEVHGLVNCAGIIAHTKEWQEDGFSRVLNVNLTAAFRMGTSLLAKLIAGRGGIVNIASMWSLFGAAQSPAYTASKTGLLGLTRSMAVAWGAKGVRVNAVAPGWIRTRLASKAMDDPVRGGQALARIPLGRWGDPADVARVIGFLLSEDAAYIHGVMLPIDGGYSIA